MKKRVLISGGTGLVGKHLSQQLLNKNYEVAVLSRSQKTASKIKYYQWNIEENWVEPEAIATADYIIHLAGSSINAKSWNKKTKQNILESRVKSTQLLVNAMQTQQNQIKAFVASSAVGFYGMQVSQKEFTEQDNAGNDFLAKVCVAWENEILKAKETTIRTAILRTGVVLAKNGGALNEMKKPIHFGLASGLGSGKQFVPWIHIDDLCALYIYALENKHFNQIYNAVAPQHCTNNQLMKQLAQAMNKPFFMPNVPAFVLKTLLGEKANLVLTGNKVSAQKIIDNGFNFQYLTLKNALKSLV